MSDLQARWDALPVYVRAMHRGVLWVERVACAVAGRADPIARWLALDYARRLSRIDELTAQVDELTLAAEVRPMAEAPTEEGATVYLMVPVERSEDGNWVNIEGDELDTDRLSCLDGWVKR